MGKLYAFGCSLVKGDALDDIWDFKTKRTVDKPSKEAWPQILADKLNLECVNIGESGVSNKQIWHRIVSTDFQPIKDDDIVVVQWTSLDRWCIIEKDRCTKIGLWQVNESSHTAKANVRASSFFNLHNDNDQFIDLNLRMSHANFYLNSIGIKQYHLMYKFGVKETILTTNRCYRSSNNMLPFNNTTILDSDLKHIQNNLDTNANDNVHPCAVAHKLHADKIYNEIKQWQ